MKKIDPDDPTAGWCGLGQRHLKKWTGHSTIILPNQKPLKTSLLKFQQFCRALVRVGVMDASQFSEMANYTLQF